MEEQNKIFNELFHLDVNEHTQQKNRLTYLSWAWAWAEVKKKYPTAEYTIERFGEEKKPYFYDEALGYMVFTTVTIEGLTHEMWLPVMDHANMPMKDKDYTTMRWKKETTVQQASMFDINTTIMRCLTKNLAMHGLGLYIYAGEDLPESPPLETVTKKQADELKKLVKELSGYLEDSSAERKTTIWLAGKYGQGGEVVENVARANFDEAKEALNRMIEKNKPTEKSEDVEQTSLMDGNTTTPKGDN